MSEPDKLTDEEMKRLRDARRAHALASVAADEAANQMRRVAIEVAAAHDCEPEQLMASGQIKR